MPILDSNIIRRSSIRIRSCRSMMHTNQQWSYQPHNNNVYGINHDDDAITVADVNDLGDFRGDLTAAGRRYLNMQPKQWCTSYVDKRKHYVSVNYCYYYYLLRRDDQLFDSSVDTIIHIHCFCFLIWNSE